MLVVVRVLVLVNYYYPEIKSMWPKSNHPSISNDFKRIPAHEFLGVNMFKFLKILICHIFRSIVGPTNIFETLIICLFFFKSTAGIVPLIH